MEKRMVAIYARVSTEHEAQLSALENQVQYYDDILSRHPDWKVYDQYIDEGITGTSIKKRKNFLRMIKDAEAGKFDLIVTREVSRFARNTVDTLQETRKLKKIGVEVWFTEDNIWTMNDEDGELRLTIMATLAQNESKKTSMRVKAGQMVSFQNAVPYGNGNILGYDKLPDHGGYVVNPEQAETVQLIFDLYESGKGEKAISYELEKRGRLTSMGKSKWQCAGVGRILNNSFYCGIVTYRKQYVPDFLEQKKINNHGAVDKVTVQGRHEPIITIEQFEKVQKMLSEKMQLHENHIIGYRSSDSVWVRKMICGQCGKHFNRKRTHKLRGIDQFAMQCYTIVRNGSIKTREKKGLSTEGICTTPMVQEWKMEMMARMILAKFFTDKESILKVADEILMSGIEQEMNQRDDDKLIVLKSKKSKLEKQLNNLLDLRLNDEISKELFIQKKEVLEKDLKSVTINIEEIELQENLTEEGLQIKIKELKKILRKEMDFDSNSIPHEIIEALVYKIVVNSPTDYEWYLNFVDDKVEIKVNGTINKDSAEFTDINKKEEYKKNSCSLQQHRLQSLISNAIL